MMPYPFPPGEVASIGSIQMPAIDLPPSQPFSSRRGFVIACGLALSVAVVNSFARFAYALILPAMREDPACV